MQLWLKLNETFKAFQHDYKRFCVRNIVRSWMGRGVSENFLWEVCTISGLEGYQELRMPELYPHQSRMLLYALIRAHLGLGRMGVKLPELDHAYSLAFGKGRKLNIGKKTAG